MEASSRWRAAFDFKRAIHSFLQVFLQFGSRICGQFRGVFIDDDGCQRLAAKEDVGFGGHDDGLEFGLSKHRFFIL